MVLSSHHPRGAGLEPCFPCAIPLKVDGGDLCAQVLVQDRPLPVSEIHEGFFSVAPNDTTEPEGIAVD